MVYHNNESNVPDLAGPPPFLRPGQATAMLAPQTAWRILCQRTGGTICKTTFYRWVSSGRISSIRLGARIFIPWPVLQEFIRQCFKGE
jgi:hypothetical protein